jgi:hypothetical protein
MAATVALLTALYSVIVVLLTARWPSACVPIPPWCVAEKTAGVFLIGFGLKLAISN